MRGMVALLLGAMSLSCTGVAQALPPDLDLTQVTSSSFNSPLAIRSPNDGTRRLFVVEKGQCSGGQGNASIYIIKNGVKVTTPFLIVPVSCDSEQGLLGLAFHPQYATNGLFFVTYSMPSSAGTYMGRNADQVLARFHVSANADVADAASKLEIIHLPDVEPNHNGGDIHFGPDGYLYWSMGDGGVQGDPNGFALCEQRKLEDNNPATCGTIPGGNTAPVYYLLGKILRLDVDHTTPAATSDMCGVSIGLANYAIPSGNPRKGQAGYCAEIWAMGLRNPFRFSFDRATGDMLIGDVGLSTTEEIDLQPAASSTATAYNYGWRNCEGNHPRGSIGTGCVTGLPDILEYHHDQGCAVIGGYRFRGGIQQLQGVYLFSDACTGDLFYGTQNGATWTLGNMVLPSGRPVGPQGFGEDVDGNVYVADANNGRIYKFTSDYIFASGFEP